MNIGKNISGLVSKPTLMSLMYTGLGATAYLAVPTLAKINGTPGALLGAGSAIVLSILTGRPEVAIGGVVTCGVHAAYVYLNPKMFASTGTALFGWSEDSYQTLPDKSTVKKAIDQATTAAGVSDQVRLPNGEAAVLYPGGEGGLANKAIVGRGREQQLQDKPLIGSGRQPMTLRFGQPKQRGRS